MIRGLPAFLKTISGLHPNTSFIRYQASGNQHSLLIAGLVRENDQFDSSGFGFNAPLVPTGRGVATNNTELVFLLKPRVIVYTAENVSNPAATLPVRSVEADEFPSGSITVEMLDPGL